MTPLNEAIVSNDATKTPEGGRIDLTQFEGVPKGPWRWKETADYGSTKPWNMPRDLVNDEGELIIEANLDVSMEEVDNLLAMSPDLIAELKRCYEKLDELEQESRVTIDEWDDKGPCVTVQYNGREYVGTLEEWNTIQRNR